MNKEIGGHTKAYCGKTNEWLTPSNLIKSLEECEYNREFKSILESVQRIETTTPEEGISKYDYKIKKCKI